MATLSSLLIGSHTSFPSQDVTISGSTETITASLTGMYIYHGTTALSLLDQMIAKMAAAGVTGASAALTKAGKVKLSGSITFTVSWDDTTLRDMLGFTGNLSGASSYTADNISKYIWFPGRGHTPEESPIAVGGAVNYMRNQTIAPDGSQVTFVHGSTYTTETLKFDVVPKDYFETENASGGEFTEFWKTVLVQGARFQHYEYQTFDSTSSDTFTPSPALGPYVLRGAQSVRPFSRNTGAPRVDKYYDLSIPMLKVAEYS